MRVLVCGDRRWTDAAKIESELRRLEPTVVIQGEARGADTLAREVAERLGIQVLSFPADWKRYKKAAGPIRNRQMLVEGCPDLVVAFHSDLSRSRGTANMVEQAMKALVPVRVVS